MLEAKEPACRFYRLIPEAPLPQRADRSADGTLPLIAYRYCEAIACASGFGWYFYPPMNISLVWDGTEVFWAYEGASHYAPLRTAQYPDFSEAFRRIAPAGLDGLAPTFLAQGKLPGVVQIWSGYLARTPPGWALLSRGVANLQNPLPFENYEGLVETDTWFGPLFTNVRLLRVGSPVDFHVHRPLFQVQSVPRQSYHNPPFEVLTPADLTAEDWSRFEEAIRPNTDHLRSLGHYAVATRKRLRYEAAD